MKKKGIFNIFKGADREDILKYCEEKNIKQSEFRSVSIYQWEDIYNKIVDEFVDKTTYYKQGLHWLNINCYFRKEKEIQYSYDSRDNWDWILNLREFVENSDKQAYYLVEEGNKFWIFEGTLNRISEMIYKEFFLQDYYIVDKKYQWMITCNHHEMIFFVGSGLRMDNIEKLLPRG